MGRKPHCNLLPNSFDFYKLCPVKICEIDISFNVNNLKIEPKIIKKYCDFIPRVTYNILTKSEQEKFKLLSSYDIKTNTSDTIDFTLNLDYRNKSLGKNRGDVRKNLDKILNK
jgi:hypothetical protein